MERHKFHDAFRLVHLDDPSQRLGKISILDAISMRSSVWLDQYRLALNESCRLYAREPNRPTVPAAKSPECCVSRRELQKGAPRISKNQSVQYLRRGA